MKINSKKITIVSLALAMGAALAGSISGSVAWYQYSTRAAAQVTGTSAGTSRNLQISLDGSTWAQYVDKASDELTPVSAIVGNDGGVESFVGHPVYQYEKLPEVTEGYLEYSLYLQCLDADKANTTPHKVAKDVYVTKFDIVNLEDANGDITDAVRIAIEGTEKQIYSKNGGDTATSGMLDINGNGKNDTNEFNQLDANTGYDSADPTTTDHRITYASDPAQASYASVAASSIVADFGDDPYTVPSGAQKIISTSASAAVELKVKVWVEGWQELGGKNCWDLAKTLAKSFRIDLRFEVPAEK